MKSGNLKFLEHSGSPLPLPLFLPFIKTLSKGLNENSLRTGISGEINYEQLGQLEYMLLLIIIGGISLLYICMYVYIYIYIYIYIYKKTSIKQNILTIKQNTSASSSG